MERTFFFGLLQRFSFIFGGLLIINFGGCKGSQLISPPETQSLIQIDSFAPRLGFPGATGYAGTVIKIFGKGFGSDANRIHVWYGARTGNKVTPLVTDSILTTIVPSIPPGKYPILVSIDSTIVQSKDSFTVLINPFNFAFDTLEFHNISLTVRTITKAGHDTNYTSTQIWNSIFAMKYFDSSYYNSSISGDNNGSYLTSFGYTIDTQSMILPTFDYIIENSSYSDGGACLGCTVYQYSKQEIIKFKNVPWVYSPEHNIIATITANNIPNQVVMLSDTTFSQQANPNFSASNTSETVGINPQAADAYIKIKFVH